MPFYCYSELSSKLGEGIKSAIDKLKNQDIVHVDICSKFKDDLKELFEPTKIIENWFIKCGEQSGTSYLEILDSDDEDNFVPTISNVSSHIFYNTVAMVFIIFM